MTINILLIITNFEFYIHENRQYRVFDGMCMYLFL